MNLYLIADSGEGGFDTFDCAVVRAQSADAARRIHPNGRSVYIDNPTDSEDNWDWERTWIAPSKVVVTHLGTSVLDEPGVVCASFNAG